MDITATDIPNFSNVENMMWMFKGCSKLVGNTSMKNWDVSKVKNMSAMFGEATLFNQNISNWNVGNVENMEGMFYAATSFNQPIGGWNTEKVKNMSSVFAEATLFNQLLNNWKTQNEIGRAHV